MEIQFQARQHTSPAMSPESIVPHKRKIAERDPSLSSSSSSSPPPPATRARGPPASESQGSANEYENGRVVCESCGDGISFRDEATGGFTVKHWDSHRTVCPNAQQHQVNVNNPVLYTPESHGEPIAPQTKRRRAKRSEEERIDYLRSDPYVAQFEAYRVLCASCDKWIRLRPNSTYCSIPWDAHRKSCLSKRGGAKISVGEDRSSMFANDPYVRKFDAERVLCKLCESWVPLGSDDNLRAVQTWMQHRTDCLQNAAASPSVSSATPSASIPSINSVPPPSRHLMALVSSSSISPAPPPGPSRPATSRKRSGSGPLPPAPPAFKDYNPSNFPTTQESRRRNAEQREATLRNDSLISEVEPNRVFCSLCKKWVQLRQDSSYCAYPWLQHRGKCLKRQQKRSQKEAELAEYRAQMEALRQEQQKKEAEDTDEPESEEGVESDDDEESARQRAQRRMERKKAKEAAKAARLKSLREKEALLNQKAAAVMQLSEGEEDAEGEYDLDDPDVHPTQLADLQSLTGRLEFIFKSVKYLFKTTYERSDDLTIAALVTYLNAAIPTDKHEDFDTTEVTKGAIALQERGDCVFEGDVLRITE